MQKAMRWLDAKCTKKLPVYVNRYHLVAWLYKVERESKPSVWYCVEMRTSWEIKSIKRICKG
jgi:hypothetical protein